MTPVKPIYTYLSVALLLGLGILFLWQPFFTTKIHEDFNYHLMVAENYQRAGGVTTWAFWESLPGGRPQNYPPLFHLLILPLLSTGLSPYQITLIVPAIFAIISLLLGYVGMRLLFNPRVAFFFLLAAVGYLNYVVHLSVIIPSSLVLISSPLLIFLITRGRFLGAGLLLATMLYTHMIMPLAIVAALLVWLVFYRRYWKVVAAALVLGFLLYLPWAINIVQNRQYVTYFDQTYNAARQSWPIILPLIALTLFLWSLIYLWKNTLKTDKKILVFFLALFAVNLPILFYKFPTRFTVGAGMLVAAIFVAYAIDKLLAEPGKTKLKMTAIAGLIAALFISPEVIIAKGEANWYIATGIITETFRLKNVDTSAVIGYAYTAENLKLAQKISENSDPDDLIYNTSSFFNLRPYDRGTDYLIGQYFAVMSNRGKVNARVPEVFTHEPLPLEKIKIVIADYRSSQDSPQAKILAEKFDRIHQEDRLVIFRNKSDNVEKIQPTKPAMSKWSAWLLIIAVLAIIIRELRKAALRT